MNLKEELKKRKNGKHFKKILYISIILVFITLIWIYYFSNKKDNQELSSAKDYFTIWKWNLEIYVSWEWNIIAWKKTELKFQTSWKIEEIYKKEWENIKKDEKIAVLDNTLYKINVEKAKLALKNAYAKLNQKKEKTTKTHKNLLDKDLESAKQKYKNTKLELKTRIEKEINNYETQKIQKDNLEKNIEIQKSNIDLIIQDKDKKILNLENLLKLKSNTIILDIDNYLNKIDELIWITTLNRNKNDSFENYLWIKNTSIKNELISEFISLNTEEKNSIPLPNSHPKAPSLPLPQIKRKKNQEGIEQKKKQENFSKYIILSEKMDKLLKLTISTLLNSVSSETFTNEDIKTHKENFQSYLKEFDSNLQKFLIAKDNLEYEKVNKNTLVEKQNNIIKSKEQDLILVEKNIDNLSIDIKNLKEINIQSLVLAKKEKEKAELDYKNTISWPTEIQLEPYYIEIENAKNNLKEAEEKLTDTVLISSIDGTILDLNYKKWEYYSNIEKPFWISISSNDKYIESYIEERDIIKIYPWQKVKVSLEAIENYSFIWKVAYVSNKWEEDSDEITKYKVFISFEEDNSQIMDAMSTSLDFLEKKLKNIILIPNEYIIYENWISKVLMKNWEFRTIKEWVSEENMTQILSWLKEGGIILKYTKN